MRQLREVTLAAFRVARGRKVTALAKVHPFLQLQVIRRLNVAVNAVVGRAQETQLRLNRLAFFDPLTGLANRECFRRRVQAFLQNSKPGNEAALLLIDLDGFKSVNAAMGHDVGDDILGQVGARLRELFVDDTLSPERTILTNYRSDPTVVRLGGDVFCVFLPHCGTSAAVSLAERVRRRLSIPFPRESGALRLGASIGVATVPNDALEYFGLILAAENAMFRAKRSGKNRVCLSGASPLDFSCQASVVSHPHDFATDHTVQFEPFFRAVDMSFAGVNAVITCLSDAGADRPTEGWFETLADVGLLRQVHYEAFDQAIEAMTELTHGGLSPLHLSVRVPVDLLLDDVFMVCVLDLLPLPFELSFAVFTPLGHPVSLADTAWAIDRLSDAGVAFVLDDFGSERGALTAMVELAPHLIRFDNRLTASVAESEALAKMTGTLLQMAHAADIGTVAQGIETQVELARLKRLRVDYVQGPALSDVLTAGDLTAYLRHERVPRQG
ncbi:MAG: diguanylate cyclase [Pseudomonadota bacterium]